MAAINFVKGEQYYTAEFQINGPVNIHIERAEAGALYFRQRSIDHGSYDLINGANWNNRGDLTIDTAIQGVVYPMWIKIESASEPTLAEMVEGEQSGGGAGTESGGVKFRYFDASKLTSTTTQLVVSNYIVLIQATKNDETKTIACLGSLLNNAPVTPAPQMFAVITDTKVILDGGKLSTFEEACAIFNITEEELSGAEITKEQFYSLEA